MLSLRVTGNVLQRLYSYHPLVDIPQIYPSWATFAEGRTVLQLSTSERETLCHSINNGHTWMGTQSRHLARGWTLLNRPIIFSNITRQVAPRDRITDLQWYTNPVSFQFAEFQFAEFQL